MLLTSLTRPKFLLPISGTYRHMIAYRTLAEKMSYKRNQIFLIENGQEVVFTAQHAKIGKKKEDLTKILQKEIAKALSKAYVLPRIRW